MRNRLRPQLLYILEAGLISVLFIQAVRYSIGTLFSRFQSALIVLVLNPADVPANTPGVVDPDLLQRELIILGAMLALPFLTLLLGRFRLALWVGVAMVAVGRVLMLMPTTITPLTAAAIALGGGLFYIAMLIRHRANTFPYFMILGLAADQLFRTAGNTLDPSWSPTYFNVQVGLSVFAVVLSLITIVVQGRQGDANRQERGLLPFWGGIGFGALLFLELSLLSTPNAVAGRADVDYTRFVPLVLIATLLPLIPYVRKQARSFISLFDGGVRGWSWMLLVALLMVIGTRFSDVPAGAALVLAQFLVSMMWWWVVRPQGEKERSVGGLWLLFSVVVFAVLVVADTLTYEYANLQVSPLGIPEVDGVLPTLVRGFRGLGLGVLLLSVFLGALPMIQTQRRIPWQGSTILQSFVALVVVIGASVGAAYLARPPLVTGVRDIDSVRIGTYNIHGGYSEFYALNLEGVAATIQQSGANVVLLQEIEAGRLTSYGVDQPLWLARRLGMDRRFFPTNEGLQGLAVLSNVEIVFDDGNLLTSNDNQTGVQRVQVRPDEGVITIYNTWLGLLLEPTEDRPLETQEQDQQRQLEEMLAIIASHHPDGRLGRTIVGGTYNNIPDSPLADRMRQIGFSDPFAGLPIELSATLWRTGLRARLDYLWVEAMLPVGAVVMDSNASDHRMPVIEVLITQSPGQ